MWKMISSLSNLHIPMVLPLILILFYFIEAAPARKAKDPESIYVRRGQKGEIPCISSVPLTKESRRLEWFKDDNLLVQILNNKIVQWNTDRRFLFAPESGALQINTTFINDTGEYICIIDGKRNQSEFVQFFIQDIPDPPGRPIIVGFTSRSANISWTSSLNTHHSPIMRYYFEVLVGENVVDGWSNAKRYTTPDNQTTYYLTDLQPFTVYSFRVKAQNSIGFSEFSKPSFPIYTLREAPSVKPTILSYESESSYSIRLQWAPPPNKTIHGEFLGYTLKYERSDFDNQPNIIKINSPLINEYQIKNLRPFTQYRISLSALNLVGEGPAATVVTMTDEGVPSSPLNLTVLKIDDTSIRLKWNEPLEPNGIIREYRVYILNLDGNKTFVKSVEPEGRKQCIVNGLLPYTRYKLWVKAHTSKGEGESSNWVEEKTDIQGPSAPVIVNLTCSSLDSLLLHWEKPNKYYKQIDFYFISYRSEKSHDFNEIQLIPEYDRSDYEALIPNLTENTLYEVKVQGASRSIKLNETIIRGEYSNSRKVVLQSKCRSFIPTPYTETNISAPLIAGVICASFALLLAVISFILWTKYFQAAYYYLDDPPSQTRGGSPQLSETYDESEYVSIPVSLWPRHVQDLHADGDIGFSREYESIQASMEVDLSCEFSQMPENKSKNRYVNIVAYDHSRVVLKSSNGSQKKSPTDYINANYIDGYCKSKAYIGTQGPLPSTFDDFWRMIWEQRVCIIVMITNLVERGRRKCDQYWPKEGTETFGIIQVKLLQEVVMATYTLRTLQIRNTKIKKKHGAERTVYQYHYTNWPDHGVPDHPLPVLSFIRKSSAANPPNGGPIIVHCSAGVGRTGTYIGIDAMIKQIKHRQSINVYGFLKHIRQQRNYLVQTEEQYIFIHDALLEAIESGDTEVPGSHLSRYIQTLQTGGDMISNASSDIKEKGLHWPLLERQYKLVTSFRAKDFNVVSALKPCNKNKNRSLNLIPLEAHRVHITPRTPGIDGSDYINATFLPGFNLLKEFIITQHPVEETFADFWQMVWDHNAQTIVVISAVNEKDFPQFWPDKDDDCDYGSFKVKLTEENTIMQDSGGYLITRDFIMQSTQDDYELMCRIVQSPGWPESCGPPIYNVFDLVKIVQTWHLEQNGSIIVMDRYGGTEAATFCCLTTLYKQLNFEDCVDVYMYAKLYHLRRPGIWRSQDDFLFLYRAMESIVSTMNLGEMTNDGSPYGSQVNVNTNGNAVKINASSEQSVKSESLA